MEKPEGESNGTGVVLTHGAGADCHAPLLKTLALQLVEGGFCVLRCNLAFRQERKKGPPHPSKAKADRESLSAAVAWLRSGNLKRVILGGHSYGGRQATMLASEHPDCADQLLLLSYPLHPPGKSDQLRTAHLPQVTIPCIFVHGSADPFGSPDEMRAAVSLIPAKMRLCIVDGGGHDLRRGRFDLLELVGDLELTR